MTATTRDKEKESWQPGIAGFCGGAISTMLLLPLDNIKVRLQVNEGIHSETISTLSSSATTSGAKTTTYPSTTTQTTQRLGAIRMLQGVIKYEGVRGLYQGLVPAIVGSAVSWGGFFYVYENMKRQLIQIKSTNLLATHNNNNNNNNSDRTTGTTTQQPVVTLNSWDNFVAGTMSGAMMVFMTNPIWLIKLRLQLQMKRASENLHVTKTVTQYDGFFDAFRKIVRSDGVLGLYKGTGPALMLTTHGGGKILYYIILYYIDT
jgi:solute carrier family 25 folate transporter 32